MLLFCRLQKDGEHDGHGAQTHAQPGGPAGAVQPHALRVRLLQLHPRSVPPHEEEDRPQVQVQAHRLLACLPARAGASNARAPGRGRGAGRRAGGRQQLAGPTLTGTSGVAEINATGWTRRQPEGGGDEAPPAGK